MKTMRFLSIMIVVALCLSIVPVVVAQATPAGTTSTPAKTAAAGTTAAPLALVAPPVVPSPVPAAKLATGTASAKKAPQTSYFVGIYKSGIVVIASQEGKAAVKMVKKPNADGAYLNYAPTYYARNGRVKTGRAAAGASAMFEEGLRRSLTELDAVTALLTEVGTIHTSEGFVTLRGLVGGKMAMVQFGLDKDQKSTSAKYTVGEKTRLELEEGAGFIGITAAIEPIGQRVCDETTKATLAEFSVDPEAKFFLPEVKAIPELPVEVEAVEDDAELIDRLEDAGTSTPADAEDAAVE